MSVRTEYPVLLKWPKMAGRSPKAELIRFVHKLELARKGTKEAVAVAMALRPEGTTQKQVISALGAPHRNKLTLLQTKRKVRLLKQVNADGLVVYKLELR